MYASLRERASIILSNFNFNSLFSLSVLLQQQTKFLWRPQYTTILLQSNWEWCKCRIAISLSFLPHCVVKNVAPYFFWQMQMHCDVDRCLNGFHAVKIVVYSLFNSHNCWHGWSYSTSSIWCRQPPTQAISLPMTAIVRIEEGIDNNEVKMRCDRCAAIDASGRRSW